MTRSDAGVPLRVTALATGLAAFFTVFSTVASAGGASPVVLALGEAAQAAARPRAGDKAPSFTLKTVDKGESRTLARLVQDGPTRGVVMSACRNSASASASAPARSKSSPRAILSCAASSASACASSFSKSDSA